MLQQAKVTDEELIEVHPEEYKMAIPSIITPMNFSLVRDAICQLIANERDAQKELAQTNGAEENWILQTIDFTIFPKRFRIPNIAEMPCIYVYFNEMDFPEESQDIYENFAQANLRIDYFTVGLSETGINEQNEVATLKTADENAEDRLMYLTAQLYKILCCEQNLAKGTNNLVTHFKIKKWQRILEPQGDNTTATVLGASFFLELGFNEPTYYCETIDIKEFYTKLEIQEEFMDPFIKIVLDSEEN